MTSIRAGWNAGIYAAQRVYEDPASAMQQENFVQQYSEYQLLWAYYNSSMFERTARFLNTGYFGAQQGRYNPLFNSWLAYKKTYNLYGNIRMIYNPVKRLVNFYSGSVYPGVLSEDGLSLPEGVPLAIPFSTDTDPALKKAIAQFWQWTNWQSKKSVFVRYGAALGSVLVEVIDDVAGGKITADIPWPGFIRDLQLDAAGNVKKYCLEYPVWNRDTGSYIYKKEVDQFQIAYYRDDEPFDYSGNGAVIENFYGFAPAVWTKHSDVGGDHGTPVFAGSFPKLDDLNGLVSHVHDHIHKVIGSPVMISSSGSIVNLFNKKPQNTSEHENPVEDQEKVLMLQAPQGSTVSTLAGDLNIADSAIEISRLITELESDHPETTFYQQLRSMSQVTGPAADRLMGDVGGLVIDAQSMYDTASMKLFQMVTAIGGERARSGAWGSLNRQQQKFTPFDLKSYEKGDLNLAIMPRPLLTPTKGEVIAEKTNMWTGVSTAVGADVPAEIALEDYGWSKEKVALFTANKAAAIAREQMLSQEDVVPDVQQ